MNNIVFKDLSTKRFKMFIFILTFLIFCICFINQIINVFDNKIYKEVLNKSENRLIYAKSDDNKIDLINSFNNVEYVTYNYNFFMQSSTFGACNFKYLVPESGKINKKYLTDDVIISSYTLEKLNLNSDEVIYIGDAYSDYQAALNANIDFGLAKWGSIACQDIPSQYTFENPIDLLMLL